MKFHIWGSRRLRSFYATTLMFTMALSASAQTSAGAGDADQKVSVESLLKRINELESAQKQMQEKLEQLNATPEAAPAPEPPAPAPVAPAPAASAPVTPTPAPAAAPDADAVDTTASDPAEPTHSLGPVQFQGFSDFDYGRAWFEKLPPGGLGGTPNSFNVGDFDLFTNTKISEHWSILGEMLVTSDFSNEFSIEMDRLMFTYKHNDYLKISFGKFSTALGYYTNAFHRAQYFQTGIGRPIMYADEDNGGLLPVHNIGVTATGKIPSGALGLHWVAEIANGRSGGETPVQNFVDENNGKAVNVQIYARPEWLNGLQTGVSVYRDTMHPAGTPALDQSIVTGHVVYIGTHLEWLNEASFLRHSEQGTGRLFHSTTSYSQIGWAFGKTHPYVRFDYLNTPESDPVFGSFGRQSGPSIGVARHVSNYVVLKLQYGRLAERNMPSQNGFTGQLAFAF